jgi:hypothetical protein
MALYAAVRRPSPSAGAGQAAIGGSSPSSHQLSPYVARSRSLEALTPQPCLASLHLMHLPLGISFSPYPVCLCLPLNISFLPPPPFTPANPSYALLLTTQILQYPIPRDKPRQAAPVQVALQPQMLCGRAAVPTRHIRTGRDRLLKSMKLKPCVLVA